MTEVKTVSVVGATGTNVAGIFASFGNAKVYCIARDIEKVKKTIPRIIKSIRAESIATNLIPTDFSMLRTAYQSLIWCYHLSRWFIFNLISK